MNSTTAQEVKRVPSSEDFLHPGDFFFIAKREAIRTFESVPIQPPKGALRRFLWDLWGKQFELRAITEPVRPGVDTVVINCPTCNGAVATTERHTITSVDPLTIDAHITCPYCQTFSFKVVEGKIMLV